MKNKNRLFLSSIITIALATGGAQAATGNWTAATGIWNTTDTNWTDVAGTPWDSTNGATNDAIFNVASFEATVSDTVFANGITLSATGNLTGGNITLAGTTPFINVAASQTGTIASALVGSAGLTKTGDGTLILSGTNTYTGVTNINGGFIQVASFTNTLRSGTTGTVNLNGGGIIDASGSSLTEAWTIDVGAAGGTVNITGANTRFAFGANKLTGSGTLTLTKAATGDRFICGGTQSGFSGKWIIDGTNGNFLGLVNPGNNFGVASDADIITLINNGKIAGVNAHSATTSVGNEMQGVVIGSGGGQFTAAGIHLITVAGAISSTGTDTLTIVGASNGIGAILSNIDNSYSGNSLITAGGVLQLGASEVIPDGAGKGMIVFTSGANVLDLNGFDETINGLSRTSGTAFIVNSKESTAATLTIGANDTTSTFVGVIQDHIGTVKVANDATGSLLAANTGGTTALTKTGSGTLTLSGANTYSGATAVNLGTLALVGGSQASPISVSSGAVLGFTLGSPTTSTSTVTFSGASPKVTVTGTPVAATLMTASNITGTPVLDPAIPGYVLAIEDGGTTLKLKVVGADNYTTWATTNGVTGQNANLDHDNDGVSNGVEYFIGGPAGNTTGFTPLPGVATAGATRSTTWTKASTYAGAYTTDFVVESSTTLADGSWGPETLGGTVTITGNDVTYTFPAGPIKNFVRLRVTGP